ncbi:MAG: chorismate mutase [Defluviitaleaceae bacterium]|nr:chorismate mutase [Defluviitaleaceae bacterium]
MIISIRGATTAENTKEDIINNTRHLLEEIIKSNNFEINQIISILFTCTKDLNAAYPAVAAREMGMVHAALMCAQEMDVTGSLPLCIRVQVTVTAGIPQKEAKHIYFKEARALRPDLISE